MVGRPILRAEEAVSETLELKEVMCGDEAAAVRHSLDIKYPVSIFFYMICMCVLHMYMYSIKTNDKYYVNNL